MLVIDFTTFKNEKKVQTLTNNRRDFNNHLDKKSTHATSYNDERHVERTEK